MVPRKTMWSLGILREPMYNCQVASRNFQPELVIYNAGTDILDGDPLGLLKVIYILQMTHIYRSRIYSFFLSYNVSNLVTLV